MCSDIQGLRKSEEVEDGKLNLIKGNKRNSFVTRIGTYELMFDNTIRVGLDNCCNSQKMTRNIISFHALFGQGYQYGFDNDNGVILVYKNVAFIF